MRQGSDETQAGSSATDGNLHNPSDGHIAAAVASKLKTTPVGPGLHLVATPIGNLADLTIRALATLARADVIACEDTRVTGKLKAAFGIETALTPYHDHNADRAGPVLIERLKRGEIVALVSDAGTPLVSDPGFRLVQAAIEAGIAVIPVPGPSAVLAALAAAGLPTDRFLFAGFLPPREKARRDALAALAEIDATLVIYESPNRLAASLADMAACLGARDAVVARELTKLHEEFRRGSLPRLASAAGDMTAKGEIAVVIAPPAAAAPPGAADVEAMLREALSRLGVRDAAAEIAAATGLPRRALYNRALALKTDAEC
mgnify:CR=1 FL=1